MEYPQYPPLPALICESAKAASAPLPGWPVKLEHILALLQPMAERCLSQVMTQAGCAMGPRTASLSAYFVLPGETEVISNIPDGVISTLVSSQPAEFRTQLLMIYYIIRYSHWAPWFITMQRCLCWVTSVLGSIPSFGRCYWYYRASWLISPGCVDTHHWWKFNVLHDWNQQKKWIGAWLGYFMGTIRRHISFCHIVTCPERESTYPHWYIVDWMLPCLLTK